MITPWPPSRVLSIRAITLLIPWLLAKDPPNPTLEDWARYQALVENAKCN